MTIRAIVVDDEPLAIERLCSMLSHIPDVIVAATAESGEEAADVLAAGGIQLLFLDVEMPQIDGFDLIDLLERAGNTIPHIVLVTAHQCHAPFAFDTGVIDFLTKPVRLARLETAVARAVRAIQNAEAAAHLPEVREQLVALRGKLDRDASRALWVQKRGESVRIDLRRVERLQAEGEYVRLFVDGRDYLHRESLASLLTQLDPDRYVRIHRSSIVDAETITAIRRRATGSYQAILRDGTVLAVGRSYRRVVRSLMKRAD